MLSYGIHQSCTLDWTRGDSSLASHGLERLGVLYALDCPALFERRLLAASKVDASIRERDK
jgi:hypothetical protein